MNFLKQCYIFLTISFVIFLFFPAPLQAAYSIEIPIGTAPTVVELPGYIVAIHKFGTAIAGILAVVMMMIGGFLWLSSAGNTNQIATGRGFITGAVIGLILVFFSYYILYAINPRLVNLSINAPKKISGGNEEVCCQLKSGEPFKTPTEWECTVAGGKKKDMAFCGIVCCDFGSELHASERFQLITQQDCLDRKHTSTESIYCEPDNCEDHKDILSCLDEPACRWIGKERESKYSLWCNKGSRKEVCDSGDGKPGVCESFAMCTYAGSDCFYPAEFWER